jgi:hypothetical protein
MATGKRKKKKPPGGANGAPPRSEPRVQLFSKFAGCNFQLANRAWDDLFAEDQDAQTDLMPMLMAIQNNAKIAPFGGIESRQNLTKLFDAPTGKSLTGIATLIGSELYAACSDMTVHYGAMDASGTPNLTSSVALTDNNATYETPTEYPYTGAADVWIDVQINKQETSNAWRHFNVGAVEQTFEAGITGRIYSVWLYLKTTSSTNSVSTRVYRGGTLIAYLDRSDCVTSPTGEWVEFVLPTPPACTLGETLKLYAASASGVVSVAYAAGTNPYSNGILSTGATDDLRFRVWEQLPPYHMFSQSHTVVAAGGGLLTSVRFSCTFATETPPDAVVVVYHGTETIYIGNGIHDVDIPLLHEVAHGDTITVGVTTYKEMTSGGAWAIDFYEAVENNTWTCLGYADDQLVGMTANEQIWIGDIGHHTLENAQLVPDPGADHALVFGNLTAWGTGLSIHDDGTDLANHPYRVSISYTLINQFGPTLPSNALTFYASKPPNLWTTSSFVLVSVSALNAAAVPDGYHINAVELYFTDGDHQEPAFLGRVNLPADTGSSKAWSFNWTGYQTDTSMWTIANLTPPTVNYTNGVPASKMAVLDGQLYFWENSTYPYRIWIGGIPGNRFSVSPGTGGGFVDVEPGVGTEVRKVLKFKTQQGAAIVTALCDNVNSQREARFNLVESSISISDEQSIKGWMAEEIAGTVGCKSSNGAVAAGDGLYAVSRYGLAITTLTMEYNSQLQIMYVSDPIAPVFLKQHGHQLDASVLFEANGVLYMTFGKEDVSLDNIIFCYDIALKAWWTYTLDTDTPILNMIGIDYEGTREGIGIITADAVYLLPTTIDEALTVAAEYEVLIESGELTTMQPIQAMHHLAQLEFRFDYFIGDMNITVTMIDQFGRTIEAIRNIHHDTLQHQLAEYIRIDQVVESYKIVMSGHAKMRLTHFLAKLYPKSNRIGMSWGFDSQQSHSSAGSIHRTFASYNDVREAIIP